MPPTLPPLNPDRSASGIITDPRTLERVVPATKRADGSVRKELRIRPGYTPQEDVSAFRSRRQADMERNALPKGHIPGWGGPRGAAATSSPGAKTVPGAAGSQDGPKTKAQKKNEKRKEKRKEKKDEEEDAPVRDDWDASGGDGEAEKGKKPQAQQKDTEVEKEVDEVAKDLEKLKV